MRSAREIAFRLRQEIANAILAAFPPSIDADVDVPAPLKLLPDPALVARSLKGSKVEAEIIAAASEILNGRYRLLGYDLSLEPDPRWRMDPVHHRETKALYFRRVPYLDFSATGDHKIIWELNRHQHLTILAQAFVLTDREEYFREIVRQWDNWVAENPFQRGINWTSALEVGFRSLSWVWIFHLVGAHMDRDFRRRFLNELYRHALHLEYNLSVYFSPNTHLQGEAVALHAIATLFPDFPGSRQWKDLGERTVREQLSRQVLHDGAHFEQSTYYHVYALDFFLLHYILAGRPADFRPPLTSMAQYLDAILGPERRIPFVGDDDGGRLFFPRGAHDKHGRATMSTAAVLLDRAEWFDAAAAQEQTVWWLGPVDLPTAKKTETRSQLFKDSGTAILSSDDFWVMMNAGGFGALSAGHTHSHALAIVARYRGEDILIDPGTYTYISDIDARDRFRGSASHNTVRVNRRDQAPPRGPFAWVGKPTVQIESWNTSTDEDRLVVSCQYAASPIVHRRSVVFQKPETVFILDEISGVDRALVEQFWHAGVDVLPLAPRSFRIGERAKLTLAIDASPTDGERSRAFGQKETTSVIVATTEAVAPVFLSAVLHTGDASELKMSVTDQEVRLTLADAQAVFIRSR